MRFIRSKTQQGGKQNLREFNSNSPYEGFTPPTHIRSNVLYKTSLFTAAFVGGSFVSVTIWEYEKIRSRAVNILRNSNPMNWLKNKKHQSEATLSALQSDIDKRKKEIEALWNKLTPGERIFVPILAMNVFVFGLWRIPSLKPFMLRYFASNPAAKAVCWPMVLSTFSHYSLFHLFANMYVLHSFSAAANSLGREQFLGLYLSAGVVSTLASYMFKVATASPGYSLGAVSFFLLCAID